MVFFVIATPLAMIGSYWGALFGNYVYILIFPQIVWGFFTWFGSVLIKMKMGIIAQIFIIALAIAVIGYLIFIFDNSNL